MTKTSAKLANYLTKFGYHAILDRQESSHIRKWFRIQERLHSTTQKNYNWTQIRLSTIWSILKNYKIIHSITSIHSRMKSYLQLHGRSELHTIAQIVLPPETCFSISNLKYIDPIKWNPLFNCINDQSFIP